MKPNRFGCVHFIGAILFSLSFFSLSINDRAAAGEAPDEILKRARKQFYVAIEEKKQIDPTIKLFKQIAQMKPKYAGRTQVYVGALTALKGKHAFFPHAKLKWTRRGLAIMDKGLKQSPSDIEALFIHGTTCYYLPFFFRRSDDAQRDFKEIIKRMPLEVDTYDPVLIAHVIAFLLENGSLTGDEQAYLQTLKTKLELQHPVVHQ